jgi:hypothetical protein
MKKKIVHQEKIGSQRWACEYRKWECGCSEFVFFDGGPAIDHKSCGNDHERVTGACIHPPQDRTLDCMDPAFCCLR